MTSSADPTFSVYLGVDGGGSKTLAVIVDNEGRELGRGLAGSGNQSIVGTTQAALSIRAAVDAAVEAAGSVSADGAGGLHIRKAWLGMAGVDRPSDFEMLYPEVAGLADQVQLTNDAELLLGALDNAVGIALISGTGSIALGRNAQGIVKRTGGWGHVIGDEGAGYEFGRQALIAAVRYADGRGPQTALLDLVMQEWNLKRVDDIIGIIYPETNASQVARLSRQVFQAARSGDAVARKIIDEGAQDLALHIAVVAKGLDLEGRLPLALAGGLLINEHDYRERTLELLQEQQHQEAGQIELVEEPALSGARAIIALDATNWIRE